jgi:hypothetical protein
MHIGKGVIAVPSKEVPISSLPLFEYNYITCIRSLCYSLLAK